MKHLFLITLLLVVCTTLQAQMTMRAFRSVKIDCTATNIPASFSKTNAASRVMSGLDNYTHIMVLVDSTCSIIVNTNYDDIAPADNNNSNVPLLPTAKMLGLVADNVSIGGSVYLRNASGACANGTVTVVVW